MKIAVYAISKNEEQFVKPFMASCKDADLVVIGDTGSTDNTVSLAKGFGAVVPEICISPWRFDKARDAVLSLIPREIDVCISLDLDEILEGGWRDEIERVWVENITRLRYRFDWGSGIVFYSEKIHSRHGYHWHHPVHEYIRPDGRLQEVYANTDKLLVTHHPDPNKSRGQYMPLLELAIKEDPYCPRNAFYHARELTFYARWQEAIVALNKYLAMPDAKWAHERCYAMRLLGKSFEALQQDEEAYKWYRLAVAEAPTTREPWCDLAMYAYRKSNWTECYFASTQALSIVNKQEVYTMDASAWTEKPHDLASISGWQLGLFDKARQHLEDALKFNPTDKRLIANYEIMRPQHDGNRSTIEQPRSGLRPTLRTDQCTLETA